MNDSAIQTVLDENGLITSVIVPIALWQKIQSQLTLEPTLETSHSKTLTAHALLQSELVGLWADRTDIDDSVSYARQLRQLAENKRRERKTDYVS